MTSTSFSCRAAPRLAAIITCFLTLGACSQQPDAGTARSSTPTTNSNSEFLPAGRSTMREPRRRPKMPSEGRSISIASGIVPGVYEYEVKTHAPESFGPAFANAVDVGTDRVRVLRPSGEGLEFTQRVLTSGETVGRNAEIEQVLLVKQDGGYLQDVATKTRAEGRNDWQTSHCPAETPFRLWPTIQIDSFSDNTRTGRLDCPSPDTRTFAYTVKVEGRSTVDVLGRSEPTVEVLIEIIEENRQQRDFKRRAEQRLWVSQKRGLPVKWTFVQYSAADPDVKDVEREAILISLS